jgi:starch-binding outer membrane protein, SusD/RagB family
MKKIFIKSIMFAVVATLGLTSCEKELLNPSTASETQVVSDVDGLVALANNLPLRYSVGRQSPGYTVIATGGLTTRELRVLNAGNLDEDQLERGGQGVDGANAVVRNLWAQLNIVKGNADLILNNLGKVSDPGLKSGLQAYASIYRALAVGTMAQFWQNVTVETATNAKFVSREDALRQAVTLLESAQATIATTPIPASFNSRVVTGLDIPNTINALIARYSLFVGDNAKAITAVGRISASAGRSFFAFDDVTRNPIWDIALANINVFQPVDLNMGLPAALKPVDADKRIDFYFLSRALSGGTYRGKGFFTANSSPMPIYLPGEMSLIRAEANARTNNIDAAITDLNAVITKTTDTWGVGAGLPAYTGAKTQEAVLTEIYRNRRIELFMSGMALEDSRRFGRPATERSRTWMPYPFIERTNNPNTPADPTN